jgi:hypothetical protein
MTSERLTAKKTTPLTMTWKISHSLLNVSLGNVSAHETSRTSQALNYESPSASRWRATRMTGASEVMADAALGFALSQSAKGGRKPAMLVRLVRVQKIEMGKICSVGQCQFCS